MNAQTSLVQTTNSEIGTTIAMGHVLKMPTQNRNVFSLVNLVPGGLFKAFGDSPTNDYLASVVLNGSRTQAVAPLIDGVTASQGGASMQNIEVSPPVDSLQEFKVEVNNLSAEAGRTAGGVVNAVTKSGTKRRWTAGGRVAVS